jgi:hypothetical protein
MVATQQKLHTQHITVLSLTLFVTRCLSLHLETGLTSCVWNMTLLLITWNYSSKHHQYHHHVAVKEVGHLFTYPVLTHPEFLSMVFLASFYHFGNNFSYLSNPLPGILFICFIHTLVILNFTKTRVIFSFFAISVFVLWPVHVILLFGWHISSVLLLFFLHLLL